MTPETRPNPDPTVLTTEQLHREMGWVKQMIEDHVVSERNHLAERKALFIDLLNKGDELMNERINGVLREIKLTGESSALAIAKSENGYEKRFENVNEFRGLVTDLIAKNVTAVEYRTSHKALEDRMNAITDRVNLRDGQADGKDTSKTEQRASQGEVRANISIGIAAVTVIGAMFLFLSNLSSKVDRNTDARVNPTLPIPATPSPSK